MGASTRYFEDVVVGAEYCSPARTITEADVQIFADFSGDHHPLHMDEAYARTTPYGRRVVHGLLGLAIIEGLRLQVPEIQAVRDTVSLGWNWSFKGPIFIGDAIRLRIRIAAKRETSKGDRGVVTEAVQMLNQRGEVVQEGEHTTMVWKRPQ
jgi:acyl dehydratase